LSRQVDLRNSRKKGSDPFFSFALFNNLE
jgi:hypothetical protein